MGAAIALEDVDPFLMERYNWRRPHQLNNGLAPAVSEENSIQCLGSGDPPQKTKGNDVHQQPASPPAI